MASRGDTKQKDEQAREVLRLYSPRLFRLFATYLNGYFARNFDAVRVLATSTSDWPRDEPLVVYCNHPGWWDPVFIMLLSAHLMPGRGAYGPIDEDMLRKYGFFRRIGLYGIDSRSVRGAAKFLSVSKAILEAPDTAIWMTPQGRFCDPRERPVRFQAGLARLARDTGALFVPMAVEYPFWSERKPEALVHFGPPERGAAGSRDRSTDEWNTLLQDRLAAAMDELAAAAIARDPALFRTLVQGRSGVNPFYDAGRYLRALFRGQRFSAKHLEDGS